MLSLCITADREGFVALQQNENGHLKSYELAFVMYSGVRKSKRKNLGACPRYFIKMGPSLSPEMGFFSCTLCLSCFTRIFWPETFVECSMTNVLGKNWRELEGDEIPTWLKTKEKGQWPSIQKPQALF